jgi:predicted peptidase
MNLRKTFRLASLVVLAACSSQPDVTYRDVESTPVATEDPSWIEAATPTPLPPTDPIPFALDSILPGQEMAYTYQSTTGQVMHYWLYIPENYHEGQSWPLIISLHGNLGFEASLDKVRQQSPTAFVGSEVDFPFIVISPLGSDGPWDIYYEPMEELIKLLGESINIDSEAQFITGLSTSGVGAWQWALAFPDRFAGLALIAGPPSSPLYEFDLEEACKLRDLPIWVGHSEADERVSIELSREAVMVLEDCGNTKVTFTVYTGLSHAESFITAFTGPELYDWMLALTK